MTIWPRSMSVRHQEQHKPLEKTQCGLESGVPDFDPDGGGDESKYPYASLLGVCEVITSKLLRAHSLESFTIVLCLLGKVRARASSWLHSLFDEQTGQFVNKGIAYIPNYKVFAHEITLEFWRITKPTDTMRWLTRLEQDVNPYKKPRDEEERFFHHQTYTSRFHALLQEVTEAPKYVVSMRSTCMACALRCVIVSTRTLIHQQCTHISLLTFTR